MELLLDGDVLRFMEMNCRLQVEHTVSEERTGKDLVIAQIEIAAGQPARVDAGRRSRSTGHVIECRINAEDPANELRSRRPARSRRGSRRAATASASTRTSSAGYVVPPFYDSLLAKVIVRGARPRRRDRAG